METVTYGDGCRAPPSFTRNGVTYFPNWVYDHMRSSGCWVMLPASAFCDNRTRGKFRLIDLIVLPNDNCHPQTCTSWKRHRDDDDEGESERELKHVRFDSLDESLTYYAKPNVSETPPHTLTNKKRKWDSDDEYNSAKRVK